MKKAPRLMIAAASSGSGKTSVTLALLGALLDRGLKVSSFKCGPDYIDPIFHRTYLGVRGYNLDLYLSGSADTVRGLLNAGAGDVSVIEGVMGYYDGIGTGSTASSWEVASATGTPAVLVVNAKGAAATLGAVIRGIAEFKSDSMIKGVILNRCSEGFYKMYAGAIEQQGKVRLYGYLPDLPEAVIESRHLGLDITEGSTAIQKKLDILKAAGCAALDIDGLLELGSAAPDLDYKLPCIEPAAASPCIAVAMDEAFCFYYRENLELLERLGARLEYFSPLNQECIPKNADALYLGGGYPEHYAKRLSENIGMRDSIYKAVSIGMPIIAECGGFLYLCESLEGENGSIYPMAGVHKGGALRTNSLSRFGYVDIKPETDSAMVQKGESIRAHEFHYWDSDNPGEDCTAYKPQSRKSWRCIHAGRSMSSGFPHLYFYSNISFARRFVERAWEFRKCTNDR